MGDRFSTYFYEIYLMSDLLAYLSIKSETIDETVVKGSRFIAHAKPTTDKQSAENYIKRISTKYRDATHNCFAYKIGQGDIADFRFSDDGEPGGTAGRPIFQAIEGKELSNLTVVVTRYFGGTKLGTGGLIRAYGGAAHASLNKAKKITFYPKVSLQLQFSFQQTNPVHQLIDKYHAEILESRFGEETKYKIELNSSDESSFKDELTHLTAGGIKFV